MTRERSPDALRNSSTLAFLNAFLIAFAIGLPSSRAIATPISSRPIVGEPAPVESTALADAECLCEGVVLIDLVAMGCPSTGGWTPLSHSHALCDQAFCNPIPVFVCHARGLLHWETPGGLSTDLYPINVTAVCGSSSTAEVDCPGPSNADIGATIVCRSCAE